MQCAQRQTARHEANMSFADGFNFGMGFFAAGVVSLSIAAAFALLAGLVIAIYRFAK
jgi:hypothetical protein